MKTEIYSLACITLNNMCNGYIDRRKGKWTTIVQGFENEEDLVYKKLILEDGMAVCEYWAEDEEGTRPTLEMINDAYIVALKSNEIISDELESLFKEAKKFRTTQGDDKLGGKENAVRNMYATTIYAIFKFEQATKAGFFPITQRKQARIKFYNVFRNHNPPKDEGGNDIFNKAIGKKEAEIITNFLINLHNTKRFPKNRWQTLPEKESLAWGGFRIIKMRTWIGHC